MPKKGIDRTEVVALRISPRRRFQLDLVAKSQQRTVSSCLEWALDYAFSKADVPDIKKVWSPHDGVRLVKLADTYPELLDNEQEELWDYIQTLPLWPEGSPHPYTQTGLDEFNWKLFRATWNQIHAHVVKEAPWDQEKFDAEKKKIGK